MKQQRSVWHPRSMRRMRPFVYRGYEVTIFVNGYFSFRYEWSLKALRSDLVRRCEGHRFVHDPTSHKFKRVAVMYAKDAVDSIHQSRLSWQRS